MVKKVDGTRSVTSHPVEAGKAVETTKVSTVGQVASAQGQAPTRAVRRPTRPMTAEERDHLIRLVEEEAEKMLGGMSPDKKKTVTSAVKMVIDAGTIEEE